MAYIGRQQDGFGVRSRFIYTATGGQTTFNTDDSGNALSYADGAYVDVYLNGVLLDPADYTATSLTSIVLGSGATASDILEVIVYDVFSVFSGTFTNGITANTLHIVGDTTDDQVLIENTNAGAANAPDLTLFRNSASPADNDVLGILRFDGKNDAAETVEYAVIQAKADDVSDGTEDGILIFKNSIAGSLSETMRIEGGNVGIGTNSPNSYTGFTVLTLNHATNGAEIDFEKNGTVQGSIFTPASADDFTIAAAHASGDLIFQAGGFTERMRISGDTLLVGKTASDFDGGIFEAGSGGTFVSRTGMPLGVNRNSSDGALQNFYKDGSQVGRINTKGGDIVIGTTTVAIRFNDGLDAIQPFKASTNAARNDEIDLGTSAAAYKEIFAQQGTINTSDENEKQQIASLTDAEIAAATAISKLFKTYKWNKAVASKGENARIHSGMIAQHVQQAMTDAGLDASKYGFFCSDTWWEKEIEVPAVEAVEARGAVMDDNKNIVAEAVDAVEAQDAYTYVEQYYSAEDAPEGATQRTRLALRYNELLSFIGAATEQRLTSIEARLTALEG